MLLRRNNKINNGQTQILFLSYFIGSDGVIYNQIMLENVERNLFVTTTIHQNIINIYSYGYWNVFI